MVRYHPAHCWVRLEGAEAVVGLSPLALAKLGEIIYLDLPRSGAEVVQGQEFGEVESAKTTAGLVAPVSGRIGAVNAALEFNLAWLNEAPLTQGWLCRLTPSRPEELEPLLSEAEYLARSESTP